jgi:hypothetical protein
MDSTKFVAWWGAILSTVGIAWDIYKFKTAGPKLRISVGTNMQGINMPQFKDKTLIMGNVSNLGDRATTITHFSFQGYKRKWLFWKTAIDGLSAIVVNPNPAQPLPYELKPGAVWTGLADQHTIEKWSAQGIVYMCVHHSHRQKPEKEQVVFKRKAEPTA